MRQYISPAINRKPQTSRVVLAGDLGHRRYRPTGMGICFKITAAVFSARMSQFGSDGLLNTFTLTKASAAPRPVSVTTATVEHTITHLYTHTEVFHTKFGIYYMILAQLGFVLSPDNTWYALCVEH